MEDSYSSVVAALRHAGYHLGIETEILFLNAREHAVIEEIQNCDACIVPGGFGNTGVEHMITSLSHIREQKIPCL